MKKRLINSVYILSFLLILLAPLVFIKTGTGVKSDIENKYLADWPAQFDGSYRQGIEQYLKDRIGFKEYLTTGYQVFNNKLSGELEHPVYTYGREGYTFFKMHNNVKYGDYHKTFVKAVVKMRDYCETRGVPFYFMFDPEKISVYRRYLPAGVNYNDDWVEELVGDLEAEGVICINNKDLLSQLSFTEQVFNCKYDAGHWNDRGCFYATNNLWKTVQKDFPQVSECSIDEFNIKIEKEKYLPISRYKINENVEFFELNNKWMDITSRYSHIKTDPRYRYFQYYVNKSTASDRFPRALVFHGSYYNRSPQFFVSRTSEYIGIHDYQNVLDIDYYYNLFQPQIVVFEVAEYVFADGYFDSQKMKKMDFNPSLIQKGQSIEKSIEIAKSTAEKTDLGSTAHLMKASGKGMDSIYLETTGDLPAGRYVYLFSEDMIFDLKHDEWGGYSVDIPHGTIDSNAILYITDEKGNAFYSDIIVKPVVRNSITDLKHSSGVYYDFDRSQLTFETRKRKEKFEGVEMQILDGATQEPQITVYSTNTAEVVASSFEHTGKTGWCTIRLNATTNSDAEFADNPVFLVKGETYYYLLETGEINNKRIKINRFEFIGAR